LELNNMNDFHKLLLDVSKNTLKDENLAKYISILFYHHEYNLTQDEAFLQEEDKVLEIDKILSTVGSEDHVATALSNKYLIGLFFISYYAAFDFAKFTGSGVDKETLREVEKETLKKLNNPSIMMDIFRAISSKSYSEKINLKNKEKLKDRELEIIKNYNERLKNMSLSVSSLEDENEQLKQRIEKAKKIWEDNKSLKEENEKLKLMLKELGANEPIVRSSTDKNSPVQDTSFSQSGTIPVPDSKNPMMTELSTPSENNIDHTRSYAHTFRERGRFGSHPSHDDFGDESTP